MSKYITIFLSLICAVCAIGYVKANADYRYNDTQKVYWAGNYGREYHYSYQCDGLGDAAEIFSGTVEEAKNTGAQHECKLCNAQN